MRYYLQVTIVRKPREVINQLSPQDALAVLNVLADSDANLAKRIAQIATEYLSEVDADDVAEEVYIDLECLHVEDVWDSIAAVPDAVRLTESQKEELDRRLDSYRRNPDAGSPWELVRERIQRGA